MNESITGRFPRDGFWQATWEKLSYLLGLYRRPRAAGERNTVDACDEAIQHIFQAIEQSHTQDRIAISLAPIDWIRLHHLASLGLMTLTAANLTEAPE